MPIGTPNTIESIRARLRRFEYGHLICLVWPGSKQDGYGRVSYKGKNRLVHKLSWEAKNGPVPEGLELDHLCRNLACANLAHLETVPHRENVRRGNVGANNKVKTHCPSDHAYTGENLYIRPTVGFRGCRECKRNRSRAARRYGLRGAPGDEGRETLATLSASLRELGEEEARTALAEEGADAGS